MILPRPSPTQRQPGQRSEPRIEWNDYDHIEPGEYSAYSVCAESYWDPAFKRWTCLIRFNILTNGFIKTVTHVPWWLALGKRAKPHAGRRSNYFHEWIRANGETPLRGDRMSPRVFRHRMARIRVRDTKGEAPYSVVAEVLSWDTGHSFIKSHIKVGLRGKQANE